MPSERDGRTSTPGVVERGGDLLGGELARPSATPQLADERLGDVGARALADDAQRRRRDARRGEPPRLREAVDVLVRLEHADEERDRLLRAAAPAAR